MKVYVLELTTVTKPDELSFPGIKLQAVGWKMYMLDTSGIINYITVNYYYWFMSDRLKPLLSMLQAEHLLTMPQYYDYYYCYYCHLFLIMLLCLLDVEMIFR